MQDMDAEILDQEPATARTGAPSGARFMDGARAVFLASGFDGASMNDIARVGRRVEGHALRVFRFQGRTVRGDHPGAELRRRPRAPVHVSARGRRRATCSTDFGVRPDCPHDRPEPHLRSRASSSRATEKFPTIGVAFYEAGPLFGATRLAERIAPRRRRRGSQDSPTPSAPPGSSSTCARATSTSRSCSASSTGSTPEEIEAAVVAGVDVFMKAYGA